ncbi:hypothetical protein I4U23_031008 [Adineta vaga]|nr:hypothetical protein I4U23_031008 [Adineta vaga]
MPRNSEKKRSIFLVNDHQKFTELPLKEIRKETIHPFRHVNLQTDYREESTQTDPFSPVYTISNGEHPEVFDLADFIYGKGLPATTIEICFIERLRARRQWEQDRTFDVTRMKIVIEREIREWQMREEEIQLLQDTRQKLMKRNLQTYIQKDEDLMKSIIDLFIYRQEKQLKLEYQRLELETSRDIRRMKRRYQLRENYINAVTKYNHLGVIGMSLKPSWHTRSNDIITTFNNKNSLPCPHLDHFIDRRMHHVGINIFKFEELLPRNALIPKIDHLNSSSRVTKNKQLQRRIQNLEKAFQLIQEQKTKQSSTLEEEKPFRFVEKIETIDHLQQSQSPSIQTEEHDYPRNILIQFQSYLRGITVQSKVANVHRIRKDLLDELRIDFNQKSSSMNMNRNDVETQIYDYLEGETIADMLDFLSKELLRLQCEQTIHLFIFLANRQRHECEEKETTTRLQSIQRQKLEDHIFRQLFSLNSDVNIEIYIQDLILQSISNTADEQARLEIKELTDSLVNHSSSTSFDIEDIISNLVHNFLLPTVAKHLRR